jgi:hypothetical protein
MERCLRIRLKTFAKYKLAIKRERMQRENQSVRGVPDE